MQNTFDKQSNEAKEIKYNNWFLKCNFVMLGFPPTPYV